MLSKPLHDQIFNSASEVKTSAETVKRIQEHLKAFGLSDKDTAILPDINFSLPELSGANIDEHFRTLALNQTEKIRDQAESIVRMKKVPPRPKKWVYREGWTKYDAKKRLQSRVAHPDDDALIFDIELMVSEGNCPTMATAVSPHAWSVPSPIGTIQHLPPLLVGTPGAVLDLWTSSFMSSRCDRAKAGKRVTNLRTYALVT